METILKLNNINKTFGKKVVVSDLSFEVHAGEVFGFLGPNGAGKTTTIKMITGFLTPDSGTIEVCGFDIKKKHEKAMERVGAIVENPDMYVDLSGMLNLKMSARLFENVTLQRINEVIKLVGLQKRINEKVKKYSLGMKQRLGIAQAILNKPKLLILDEPTNGLDPAGIQNLRNLLKCFAHEKNMAVFVSSHMLSEMEQMCDRVAVIKEGHLLEVKALNEEDDKTSKNAVYRFLLCPNEKTIQMLKNSVFVKHIKTVSEKYIDFDVEEKIVPSIVKYLCAHDCDIYGVAKLESTLEERFIRLTGGGNTIV